MKIYIERKLDEEEIMKEYLNKEIITNEDQAKILYLSGFKKSPYTIKELSEKLNYDTKNLLYLVQRGLLTRKKVKNNFFPNLKNLVTL